MRLIDPRSHVSRRGLITGGAALAAYATLPSGIGHNGVPSLDAEADNSRLLAHHPKPPATGGSITKINSFSMLSLGSPNPVITYDPTGLAAGQWLTLYASSPTTAGGTIALSGGRSGIAALAAGNQAGGSYYNTIYAVQLVSGDLSAHQVTLTIPDGGVYIHVEILSVPGCTTAQSFVNWYFLVTGATITQPANTQLTGSVGYNLLGIAYNSGATNPAFNMTASPGTIHNDVIGASTSGSMDSTHYPFASSVVPSTAGSQGFGGVSTTAFQGGMIEFGT